MIIFNHIFKSNNSDRASDNKGNLNGREVINNLKASQTPIPEDFANSFIDLESRNSQPTVKKNDFTKSSLSEFLVIPKTKNIDYVPVTINIDDDNDSFECPDISEISENLGIAEPHQEDNSMSMENPSQYPDISEVLEKQGIIEPLNEWVSFQEGAPLSH